MLMAAVLVVAVLVVIVCSIWAVKLLHEISQDVKAIRNGARGNDRKQE